MTKKKGKDARSAGAVNTARRAGETVETKQEVDLASSVTASLLPRKRSSRSTLIPLSLVVESTVQGVEVVGSVNTGAPVRDG